MKGFLSLLLCCAAVPVTVYAEVPVDGARGMPGFPAPEKLKIERYAYVDSASTWKDPRIYVCWEGDRVARSPEAEWVRLAIDRTWGTASRKLEFRGWQACSPNSAGIRIHVEDAGPHVKALGRRLANLPQGMVLNFTFENWSDSCAESEARRRLCIESIAVHEFGHALGLAHEQNRPDAPGECAELRQGSDGDVLLTPYDPDSVMNYCNPVYNNDGQLSDSDVSAIRLIYDGGP